MNRPWWVGQWCAWPKRVLPGRRHPVCRCGTQPEWKGNDVYCSDIKSTLTIKEKKP